MEIKIREALLKDDSALLNLMANAPMQGLIQLTFEKQPSFFNYLKTISHRYVVVVAEDINAQQIVACIVSVYRPLYINGKVETVSYAIGLRVLEEYRGRGILSKMASSFERTLENRWSHNVILKGNQKAEQIFLRKMPVGIPQIHKHGEIHSYFVLSKQRFKQRDTSIKIIQAKKQDIPEMQALMEQQAPRYQFYPQYDLFALGSSDSYYQQLEIDDYVLVKKNNQIIAFAALWNKQKHQQIRVVAYHPALQTARSIINVFLLLFGRPCLPRKGELLNHLSLCNLICAEQHTAVMPELIAYLLSLAYAKGAVGINIAFDSKDQRKRALKKFIKHKTAVHHAILTLVGMPYPEFDDRPVYVEMCRL